jgi:hypothetical protein
MHALGKPIIIAAQILQGRGLAANNRIGCNGAPLGWQASETNEKRKRTIVSDVIRASWGLVYRQTALDRMKLDRYRLTKLNQEVPQ